MDNIHTLAIVISPNNSGTVEKTPDKATYAHNEQVTITATPTGDYVFLQWQNDLGGTQNPYTFNIGRDTNAVAGFNIPPVVTITSPPKDTTLWGKTEIKATASDTDGIESVKFYIDEKLKTTDTQKPYSYKWDTLNSSRGIHAIKAIATDKVGLTSTDKINIIVSKMKLTISGVLKSVSSWLFKKDYRELTMAYQNPNNLPVSEFVLSRKEVDGDYQEIIRFSKSDFTNGTYIYSDLTLSEDISFLYKFVALDFNNQVIGSSPEIKL